MEQFFIQNGDIVLRLVIAMFLGMLVGTERFLARKEAGVRTHALVSVGSALFVIISEIVMQNYANMGAFDPMRMASQIVVGIGFLGAGSIILEGSRLKGLTTAGGLWVTAGIGMAAGFGLFGLATISTVLVLLILIFVYILEKPLLKISEKNDTAEKTDN
ncbi:MAG TPA: MgtC/SapB family protein [Candidatus Paceibacterota bacterium]|nr:MgtC/SapB family protein [Candidatus Paceibacterota bacterium]HPT18171.1 MgtC/SapB family protein [Candidatus Paceibacterota bacterium]